MNNLFSIKILPFHIQQSSLRSFLSKKGFQKKWYAFWNETSISTFFAFESQPCITEKTGSYFMPDKSVGLVFKKRPSL